MPTAPGAARNRSPRDGGDRLEVQPNDPANDRLTLWPPTRRNGVCASRHLTAPPCARDRARKQAFSTSDFSRLDHAGRRPRPVPSRDRDSLSRTLDRCDGRQAGDHPALTTFTATCSANAEYCGGLGVPPHLGTPTALREPSAGARARALQAGGRRNRNLCPPDPAIKTCIHRIRATKGLPPVSGMKAHRRRRPR